MRVAAWAGVLCGLLLLAGAVEGGMDGSPAMNLSVFLKRLARGVCFLNDIIITPTDDELYWRVGATQQVWCSVVEGRRSSLTSADLSILKNNVPIPHKTVNESTIQVTLNLTKPESYKLICTTSSSYMCMTQVYVGYEPLDVENLQCVSHNWESFSCNWTLPYNPVQESNNDYRTYLMSLGDPSTKSGCSCQDYNNLLGDSCQCPETCCLWTGTSYFAASPQVVVMFEVDNHLGAATFNHTIDNYAVVLPDQMKSVTVEARAGKLEALVQWELPAPMGTFAEDAAGVVVRVDHRLADDGGGAGEWILGEGVLCHADTCKTGQQVVPLEHWWLRYEVRVRLRSAAAPQNVTEDGWWSDWQPRYVNTSAAAPDAPPGVGPGTFQVTGRGFTGLSDLTLAWQTLAPLLHNGPNFGYLAQLFIGDDDDEGLRSEVLGQISVTDNFAVFQNVTSSASYMLRVSGHNSEGVGPWATVQVAAAAARPTPPLLPVVVQHAGAGRQEALYELRWAPEDEGTYTVYLCTGEQEGARPCTGQLYWTSAGNASATNLTLRDFGLHDASPSRVSFAVSAEGVAGASSGFSWDRCGAPQPYSSDRSAPQPQEPVAGSSWVQLPWTLSCSFWAGVVEEVEATYCRGTHTSPDNCTEESMTATGQPWTGVVTVAGLDAGEEYTAWLRLHYRGGASPWADGQTFATSRAGAEVWLIVVVAGVGVLATVTLVFGLAYSRRKFVDNLKKLRVKPSLPSGLVPVGRQQDPRGSYRGEGGGTEGDGTGGSGRGGGGIPLTQNTSSPSVENPAYTHILPTVVGPRSSLSLKDQEVGGDLPFGRGMTQNGRLVHQQQQQQQRQRSGADDNLLNASTEQAPPRGGTSVLNELSDRSVSPSTSDPLLRESYTSHYVSPYFSESESESRDLSTPTPLLPGGYVGLSGSVYSGGGRGEQGRGRGGCQSSSSEVWSGVKSSRGSNSEGNSGYVSSSEFTKLPGMSATPSRSGYVTAEHGERIADRGYVSSSEFTKLPGMSATPSSSGYVTAEHGERIADRGYVSSSEFTKLPGMSATLGSSGYVTAEHGERIADRGYVSSSESTKLPGMLATLGSSGYVTKEHGERITDRGYVPPPECAKVPGMSLVPGMSATKEGSGYVTSQHGEHIAAGSPGYVQADANPHPFVIPEGGDDPKRSSESGCYVSADFPMVMIRQAPPGTTHDPVTTSTDPPASSHDQEDSTPPTVSLKGVVKGGEEQNQIEKPSYVSLPDAQLNMEWLGGKYTVSSDDKFDVISNEGLEKPIQATSDAPAPGYIAVQPPDFGKPVQNKDTAGKTGNRGTEPYQDPGFLSALLSKAGQAFQDSPDLLVSPVYQASIPDVLGAPCEAKDTGMPHLDGSSCVGGYVPLPAAAGDDTSGKGRPSAIENSGFSSLVSPFRASEISEVPLTDISFIMLNNIPSRTSSVSERREIKETNMDSGIVEVREREADEGMENERAENAYVPMDDLPQGYSRVGEPPE